MGKKTLLQTFILLAIQGEPTGTTIRLPELYKKAKDLLTWGAPTGAPANVVALCNELRMCAERGDLPNEPRWKNDIRWAIRHARDAGILKHAGTLKSGEWLRI
jgi:hypothetical protein